MKKIFRKYPETILAMLAVLFLGIIVASFVWGAGTMTAGVNSALNADIPERPYAGFNLSGAQALDLRGLVKLQP